MCIDIDLSIFFDALNSNKQFKRVFFKFILLLWSLFNLKMYTHV